MAGFGLVFCNSFLAKFGGFPTTPEQAFEGYPAEFLDDTGIRVRVRVGAREVEARVRTTTRWSNAPLYLLEPVDERDAWITHRLYEPSLDRRVAQEILLGIGGVRALAKLGLEIDTYHFNEGHAVFAGVELIADRMEADFDFPTAWREVREKIVFTTHTPVPAGNEVHAIEDLRRLGAGCELVTAELREIGGDPFNMTVAGLRLACRANAVAQLHGETARAMWAHVDDAAPILAITNGVHRGTWQDPRIAAAVEQGDEALREARRAVKGELLAEIEARTGVKFEREALTIGFARRAATYKRPDLLLRDPARLAPLLKNRRLQLVFSGKAHPADQAGKSVIALLVQTIRQWPESIVYLENYDMALGRLLTRGCDVWLNTPRRPMEASGTSGMKAAMNGSLNLSILDGWWPEGCEHGVTGWAIGDTREGTGQDARDLQALYDTLEGEVLPAWADTSRWTRMMRASIAMGVERFSSDRMVREYFDRLYAATGP